MKKKCNFVIDLAVKSALDEFCEQTGYAKCSVVEKGILLFIQENSTNDLLHYINIANIADLVIEHCSKESSKKLFFAICGISPTTELIWDSKKCLMQNIN